MWAKRVARRRADSTRRPHLASVVITQVDGRWSTPFSVKRYRSADSLQACRHYRRLCPDGRGQMAREPNVETRFSAAGGAHHAVPAVIYDDVEQSTTVVLHIAPRGSTGSPLAAFRRWPAKPRAFSENPPPRGVQSFLTAAAGCGGMDFQIERELGRGRSEIVRNTHRPARPSRWCSSLRRP